MWVRKTIQKGRRKTKFKSIIQICIWQLFFFPKGKFLPFFMQKILIKQIGKYYKKITKIPRGTGLVYQLKKGGKTTSFEIVTEKCQNRFWRGRLPKVIYTKYSKHWPYTGMLNHGLNHGFSLSFFKLISCPIHWIVCVLAYLDFIFEF